MTIVVERTFAVTADSGAVLGYLTDLGHSEQWDPATRRTTRTGSGPIVIGSSWRTESKVLGLTTELLCTLTAAGADRLVFVGRNEGSTSTGTFTVRPIDGGTEVTYHLELEMHGVAKLATPVVRIEFEKLATATAGRLAGVLNRLASPAPPGTPTGS